MKKSSGTYEWASSTANCISGCERGCWYCYAKAMAVRFGRCKPEDWTTEKKVAPIIGKRRGRIMAPSAHDITIHNYSWVRDFLAQILGLGNRVLIVSKPEEEVIAGLVRDLAKWQDMIEFRFTIGSADDKVLSLWEPNAPSFEERLTALAIAHHAGFKTSVSIEPMLDDRPWDVAAKVKPMADTIWFGLPRQLKQRLTLNGAPEEVMREAERLVEVQSDDWVKALFHAWLHEEKARWKDSIRKIVGLTPLEGPE